MKIGVISDTHSLFIPSQVSTIFAGVDLIIHAGDICDANVIKSLQRIAPVKAVQGNMDEGALKAKLPIKEIIVADQIQIGVTHGHLGPKDALTNARAQFKDTPVNVIVYGHSHHAYNEVIDGVLCFNPGSPNDIVKAKFFSCGILKVQNGKVSGEIIHLS